jgi:type II secretory pathway component GspD/PulD (secretin)
MRGGWISTENMRRIALLLLALAPVIAAADEARILYLKHRPAAEIIPVIRPLLGPGDALSGMDYRLIIRAPDAKLNEIERILPQLDVAPRRLRITVQQAVNINDTTDSQSLSGEARAGKARIMLPGNPGEDRDVAMQQGSLRYNVNRRTASTDNGTTQTVLTQDGQRAYIRIGQSVPHVQKILALSRNQAVITQGVVLQDVTTGFEVVPHVHGDSVRLEITPRLSTLQDPATGLADFQELSTTIEAKLGEWIDLGAVLGSRDEVERAILASGSTAAGERRTVRLKIE